MFKLNNKDTRTTSQTSQTCNCRLDQSHISLGHARKSSSKETGTCSEITNCLHHQGVLNVNKPGKAHVIFDPSPKFQNTSLNNNLFPNIDLLNNLIKVLLGFQEGQYAVIVDIKKMFHQIRVNANDTDALRFLQRDNLNTTEKIILCQCTCIWKSRFTML